MPNQDFSEAEIQALIALIELSEPIETPNNNFYTFFPKSLQQAQTYFRRFSVDLSEVFHRLADKGYLQWQEDAWQLTAIGKVTARQLRIERLSVG